MSPIPSRESPEKRTLMREESHFGVFRREIKCFACLGKTEIKFLGSGETSRKTDGDPSAIARGHCQFHDEQMSRDELERKMRSSKKVRSTSHMKSAGMLNISQPLLNSLLKFKSDIETAVQKKDNVMSKRKRCQKDENVEDAVSQSERKGRLY
ncbi:hypothetical protein AVEN_8426-1 [Araneus ventricosus]|uniref:Uncharacterized protein n=1 Tax=Araneus ventricosus TaxID=182803 RepID=A0A4Y2QPE6_ARAVE|nr:hypothetical protein AVEN_8426-1 [Araneus ventricosus]